MAKIPGRFRQSEFLRNVITLVSANTVAQAVAILIYPILTRIYSPEEFGLFALYMSIISITAIIATGKYELSVILPKEERKSLGLLKLSLYLSIIFSLFLFVIALFFRHTISEWLGNPNISNWLLFVPLSTLLVSFFQTLTVHYNRHKRYKRIAGGNLSQSITNSLVKISTFRIIPKGGGLILGAITGQLAGAMIFAFKFFRQTSKEFFSIPVAEIKNMAQEYKLFPKFNMLHYLVNNFSSSLPIFFFSTKFTAAQVGFYSIGFMMIHRPMNLLTSSLFQVFSQKIIEKHNNSMPVFQDIKKIVLRLFLIAIVPFSLAAIAGPSIFRFVFGAEWAIAGKYMQLLLPWLFMVFLSSSLSFLPDMLSRQQTAMWIDIIKFILRAAVLFIGIHYGGIYLSIALFSGISFLLVSISLIWYVNLARKTDRNISS